MALSDGNKHVMTQGMLTDHEGPDSVDLGLPGAALY